MTQDEQPIDEASIKKIVNDFYIGKDIFSQQRFEGEPWEFYKDRLKNMNRAQRQRKKGTWFHKSSYDVMKETADGKSVETVKKTYVKPKE